MTLATSIKQIRALGPCAGGYRFAIGSFPADGNVSAAEAREAGCSLEDMSWYLSIISQGDFEIERRFRHWKADVATHVLHVFEAAYPHDLRPREAILAAHAWAEGSPFDQSIVAGAQASEDLAWDGNQTRAAQAAAAARTCGERRASWVCSRSAIESVRETAEAERKWQYDRLVEWFTGDGPGPLEMPL